MNTEILTLLGSTFGTALMGLWSKSMDAKAQQASIYMAAQKQVELSRRAARKFEAPGIQWTRRIITLTVVFFVVAFPKLVAVYMPDMAVHIGYLQFKGFWFFTSDTERVVWEAMKGLVITPLDTHLLSAIIGFYFGGRMVR